MRKSRLIEHFVSGSTARCVSELAGVNRKTAAYYFHRLRMIISKHLEEEASEFLSGEIEVDESSFGGGRKGKRGRGPGGKIPVFGLLKRGGRVYTKIIADAKKVIPDSIVYSDCWRLIMLWMFLNLSITELIIVRCLHKKRTTSMGSKTFGIRQKDTRGSLMASSTALQLILEECE